MGLADPRGPGHGPAEASPVGPTAEPPSEGGVEPRTGESSEPGTGEPATGEPGTGEPGTGEAEAGDPETAEPTTQPAIGPGAPETLGAGAPAAVGVGEPEPVGSDDSGDRMRVLVIDAATFGIDPVVGQVASGQMRMTAAQMGYSVLSATETVATARQLRMPYPPTPADLWRVSWTARVHRGAFARIWAHGGQYVIEISVASVDGSGPFFQRGTAGADDLREEVDRLLRATLPATHVWNASPTAPQEPSAATSEETAEPEPEEPEEPEPELRRWSLTAQTEAAFGVSEDFFYNHMAGLRLDFRITRTMLLGAYVSWANLNARNGRADNIFFMLQFENRIRISSELDLTIPLRVGVGYLPFNGAVIRLAAGLNYAVSPDWEIGADILTPTFWFLADGNVAVSLNVGLEATYRF